MIIEIEGAENSTLEGVSKLLDISPKSIWLVEISRAEHQLEAKGVKINPNILETFEKFCSRGYKSVAADSLMREITSEEVHQIIKTKIDTLGTHNFLFYDQVLGVPKF